MSFRVSVAGRCTSRWGGGEACACRGALDAAHQPTTLVLITAFARWAQAEGR